MISRYPSARVSRTRQAEPFLFYAPKAPLRDYFGALPPPSSTALLPAEGTIIPGDLSIFFEAFSARRTPCFSPSPASRRRCSPAPQPARRDLPALTSGSPALCSRHICRPHPDFEPGLCRRNELCVDSLKGGAFRWGAIFDAPRSSLLCSRSLSPARPAHHPTPRGPPAPRARAGGAPPAWAPPPAPDLSAARTHRPDLYPIAPICACSLPKIIHIEQSV